MSVATGSAAAAAWPVWGHEDAIADLSRAVREDRVLHAYLLAGPAGIGKALLARTFAQALCCDDPAARATGVPCGACRSCRKIVRGVHPDVQVWDLQRQAAGEKSSGRNTSLTIETVRQLRGATAYRPVESARRVVIVDDAETMQDAAQEALLKTLEEPPAAVVMVLVADDAEALLPTIRSRCRIVDLHPVPASAIEAGLIAAGVAPDAAATAAGLARGRAGWAARAAADPALLEARRQAFERARTWIAQPVGERMVTAALLGDRFAKQRDEIFAEVETALAVWRDALLEACGLSRHLTYRGYAADIADTAAGFDLAGIARALGVTQQALRDLEANVRPRLALEGMVLQWPTPSTR